MNSQLFAPVNVNKQTIHWRVISGIAVGVQKYTKTHVSGGGDSSVSYRIETITELSIQQDNGDEIDMTVRVEELQVRDGQRVSGIFGYTQNKDSNWLIFVNRDRKKWYWVTSSYSFFESLGMFVLLPIQGFPFFITLLIPAVVISFLMFGYISMIGIIIGIILYAIPAYRIFSAWKTIKPQLVDSLRQFIK